MPAADGAADRQRRVRATRRDSVEPLRPIEIRCRQCRALPCCIDTDRRLARLGDQPETVTADRIHMRIDDGDRGCSCDHCLDGIAAVAEHAKSCFGSEMMRRSDHAAKGGRGIEHGNLDLTLGRFPGANKLRTDETSEFLAAGRKNHNRHLQ